ncbi:MAG: adenylosuccinate lyase [Candidatus Sungbacteria bacterium RIFCSPHIGHO2_02_FULL_47_11]|uniref:Adenylosuccinate lyase n=1 Tax=Candidatus Sungbacteria bacterium RIFCSPHIGHO2_02_FULL_47_11 TaxID=1802270 RepID=A0A1G2KLX9_9BACT|nr:MAG: adenylosuccinate lyase [Candidatus Sungbacteria bacterium RIFCSPHIGHO2_02_FULL_47_11]
MKTRDPFDSISPVDYRYWDEEVARYLSENGFIGYKLQVELALIAVLFRRGICSEEVGREVTAACVQVTTAEVYEEEDRIWHDIRALVNCIRAKVSESAKPYVHMTATSYDIIDTANAARYRDAVEKVLIPSLIKLEGVLIGITLREAETVQIGRTHGQHAVPITFGFALAGYVSRLGGSIEALKALAAELPGKFSGAVGAYNASSLFFDDPEEFEAEVLAELGLAPAEHSTQIVPPEALTRLFCEVTITAGILANLSDDMRNLQRTEIGEVGEEFEAEQVGSSTMPQKRNPINFENAKSCWKIVAPRIVTVFMDQISEHQRDLTNSASARTYGEVVAYVVSTAKRLTRTMRKIIVDHENLLNNLEMTKGGIAAEPLQLILSAQGHPDAHEKVRTLTLQAQREARPLEEILVDDKELRVYVEKMTPRQRQILINPQFYTGIAPKKAKEVAERWKQKFGL